MSTGGGGGDDRCISANDGGCAGIGSSQETRTTPRYADSRAKPHWSRLSAAAGLEVVLDGALPVGALGPAPPPASRSTKDTAWPSAATTRTRPHVRAMRTPRSKCHVSTWPGTHLSTVTRKPTSVARSVDTPSAHPAKSRELLLLSQGGEGGGDGDGGGGRDKGGGGGVDGAGQYVGSVPAWPTPACPHAEHAHAAWWQKDVADCLRSHSSQFGSPLRQQVPRRPREHNPEVYPRNRAPVLPEMSATSQHVPPSPTPSASAAHVYASHLASAEQAAAHACSSTL